MSNGRRGSNRNGRCAQIVAFVAAHPGTTAPEIERAVGLCQNSGLLAYCVNVGKVFRAGRRRSLHYYATEALATANDAKHHAEAAARTAESVKATARQDQLRKRAKRHAAGVKPVNTRPRDAIVRLEPEVRLAGNVRITSVKAPPGRFEVVGPFVGQITQDWLQRLPPEARERLSQTRDLP